MTNLLIGLLIGLIFGAIAMFFVMIKVITVWIVKGKMTWNKYRR